jgi:hypothetical protein
VRGIPKDGEYSSWELSLAHRHPLSLSEMRWPSTPLEKPGTMPTARWGIECGPGWRQIIEQLLVRLEAAIAAQPVGSRDDFRVVQIKEKFGRLTVYLATAGLPDMTKAIDEASEASTRICEICSAPGRLEERRGWWSTRCPAHESGPRWGTVGP